MEEEEEDRNKSYLDQRPQFGEIMSSIIND